MQYLKKLQLAFVKGEFKNPVKGQARQPGQVYSALKDIKEWTKETLIGVYLNEQLEINSYTILSVGGASITLVLPEEIFQNAILTRAPYFILIHNHPSGQTAPSASNRAVIAVLKEQSKIMNRIFLDFIIVGAARFWSMFEEDDGGEYILSKLS